MRVLIVRREPGIALSMDVYADSVIAELRKIRPTWTIDEIAPELWSNSQKDVWHSGTGFRKYYERFWCHPRKVCQQETDLFHIIDHGNAHVAYWLKSMGKPIVVTCHDLVPSIDPEILQEQSRFPAFSRATWQFSVGGMRQADQIISVSENTAQDVVRLLRIPSQQITAIPNGVDSQFCQLPSSQIEPLRQKYNCLPETVYLLNVGSNHKRKNISTVLKSLKLLHDWGLPVHLWKAGDDFTSEQKAFIVEHSLTNSVTYLGKPDKADLIQIYNIADILLAPSLYEGFGLTVLEAMACGTPVITSDVSSLPEVAGNATIIVNPMDFEAISEAVCCLQNDRAYRQTLVDRGLARVKLFSWQRTAEQIALVYEKLVDKKFKNQTVNKWVKASSVAKYH